MSVILMVYFFTLLHLKTCTCEAHLIKVILTSTHHISEKYQKKNYLEKNITYSPTLGAMLHLSIPIKQFFNDLILTYCRVALFFFFLYIVLSESLKCQQNGLQTEQPKKDDCTHCDVREDFPGFCHCQSRRPYLKKKNCSNTE